MPSRSSPAAPPTPQGAAAVRTSSIVVTSDSPHVPPNGEEEKKQREKVTKESKSEKDEKDEKNTYLVDWEPNDVANPQNWSTAYKSWITVQLGMLALAASLGSSIISPAENAIMDYTRISSEVAVLPISFYILGFAFGPLLWAPVSEVCPMINCRITSLKN